MLTGKQREIQARDGLFVSVARKVLLEEGYPEVTIQRVAEETGFSKGTVYQRFGGKEELVVAVGLECRARLLDTIEWAARFDGRPRERMVAIGEAIADYFGRHPHDQRILKIIDAETILAKVPEKQQEMMGEYDVLVFQAVLKNVQDAITQGDLTLPAGMSPVNVCFAFWTMVDGAFAAGMGSAPLSAIGLSDPIAEVIRNGHYLLDGYGWRPLFSEWDYAETSRRVQENLKVNPVASVRGGKDALVAT